MPFSFRVYSSYKLISPNRTLDAEASRVQGSKVAMRYSKRWVWVNTLTILMVMILGLSYSSIVQAEEPKEAAQHYTEGLGYLNEGELDAAESEFEEAVRLDPEYLEALGSLALVYLKREKKTHYQAILKRIAEVREGLSKPRLTPIEPTAFDIAILIDTSGSTWMPAGVDGNGNGIVGQRKPPRTKTKMVYSFFGLPKRAIKKAVKEAVKEAMTLTDPGDSILAAEVLAAKKLIAKLDPRTNRVAIISFSGDYLPGTGYDGNQTFLANPATPDAFLEQPLTSNFRMARDALDQIKRDGPEGGSNIAEGIRLALSELTGLSGSISAYRREAKKAVLLLTDGVPTFSEGSAMVSDPEDVQMAISAATVAGRYGIKVYTFSLGKQALSMAYTGQEMARVTAGRFTPVAKPGDIITVLPGINLTESK